MLLNGPNQTRINVVQCHRIEVINQEMSIEFGTRANNNEIRTVGVIEPFRDNRRNARRARPHNYYVTGSYPRLFNSGVKLRADEAQVVTINPKWLDVLLTQERDTCRTVFGNHGSDEADRDFRRQLS
jgi:hypothetical protein